MPKSFQYVCDKCGKTEFSEIQDTPKNWWAWGDTYFCSECFACLRNPVCKAMDAIEEYLGKLLDEAKTPEKRRRVSAMITRDVINEIWKTLPRPEDNQD